MKIAAKTGLLASALGLLFAAGNSAATTYEFDQQSNAVNYCQGFVPSAANRPTPTAVIAAFFNKPALCRWLILPCIFSSSLTVALAT